MTGAALLLCPFLQPEAPADDLFGRRVFAAAFAVGIHALVLLPLLTIGPPPTPAATQAIMVGVAVEARAVQTAAPRALPAAPVPAPTRAAASQQVRTATTAAPPSERSIAADDNPAAESHTPALPATTNAKAETGDAVEPPRYQAAYLSNPQPPYPLMSKQRHEEGTVRLYVMVDTNGRADTVRIKTGSGYERLDMAARAAVQQWRFIPARSRGQNVAGWVEVPVQFQLEK
jgi:protein TonB